MRNGIRAGDLRTLAAIGRPTVTRDAAGAEVIEWDSRPVWAYLEPLAGKEWATPSMLKDGADFRITIHRIDGWIPSPRWRFVAVDNPALIFNVTAVMANPTNALVECLCRSSSGETDGR
jgi:head-tail adaptor